MPLSDATDDRCRDPRFVRGIDRWNYADLKNRSIVCSNSNALQFAIDIGGRVWWWSNGQQIWSAIGDPDYEAVILRQNALYVAELRRAVPIIRLYVGASISGEKEAAYEALARLVQVVNEEFRKSDGWYFVGTASFYSEATNLEDDGTARWQIGDLDTPPYDQSVYLDLQERDKPRSQAHIRAIFGSVPATGRRRTPGTYDPGPSQASQREDVIGSDNVVPGPGAANQHSLGTRVRFWQATTAGAIALSLLIAVFSPREHERARVAVLRAAPGAGGEVVAFVEPNGAATVRLVGSAVVPLAGGLELWALSKPEWAPRSLGMLPLGGGPLLTNLDIRDTFAVSLEQKGGSPSGLPTSPVMYGGSVNTVWSSGSTAK